MAKRSVSLTLKPASEATVGEGTWDDVARVLTGLSRDVERFRDLVDFQRRVLDDGGIDAGGMGDDELVRQAQRLSAEAERVAAAARRALDEMRRTSPAGG